MTEFISGPVKTNYRIAIYGPAGIGKSTIASKAEKPLFIDFEDALDHIDCTRTRRVTSMHEIKPNINAAMEQGFKTIVFDSVDAIQSVMVRELCKQKGVKELGDMSFGRGYEALNTMWIKFMDMVDYIKSRGLNVILVAHDQVKRYEDPRNDGYDRILLLMHQKSANTVISRLDGVFYMAYDYTVIKSDNAMQKQKAIGSGKRVIFTEERPAFIAKNRFSMPSQITDIGEFYKYLT